MKVEKDWFDSINSQCGEGIYFYLHCPMSKNHSTAQNVRVFWPPTNFALTCSILVFRELDSNLYEALSLLKKLPSKDYSNFKISFYFVYWILTH